jgi:phosphate transport system substrate-binding protein
MKKISSLMAAIFSLVCISGTAVAGNIDIKGSTTVLPIAQKAAEVFMKGNPNAKITVSGGGSGNGIKAIIDGTTDIADASRFIKDKEAQLAMEKGVYPVPCRVALDSIVPAVNPKNKVTNLTTDQLRDIYMGKITNWKEVGGDDKEIVVISRDTSSGTFEAWKEMVMKDEKVVQSALTVPSNGAIVQTISKTDGAIGYVGYGYLTKDIKAVSVNGISANVETTLSGAYPVSRPLFMFTKGWPEGETLDFINFVISKKGQELVKEAGFIPMY